MAARSKEAERALVRFYKGLTFGSQSPLQRNCRGISYSGHTKYNDGLHRSHKVGWPWRLSSGSSMQRSKASEGWSAVAASALGVTIAASLAYCEPASGSQPSVAAGSRASALPEAFLRELQNALGEENVTLDSDERMAHAKPWNSYHPVKGIPGAVVYPR